MGLLWLILGAEGGPIGYNPCIFMLVICYILLLTTLYGMYPPLKWAPITYIHTRNGVFLEAKGVPYTYKYSGNTLEMTYFRRQYSGYPL